LIRKYADTEINRERDHYRLLPFHAIFSILMILISYNLSQATIMYTQYITSDVESQYQNKRNEQKKTRVSN
jgi:hypothetical protein